MTDRQQSSPADVRVEEATGPSEASFDEAIENDQVRARHENCSN